MKLRGSAVLSEGVLSYTSSHLKAKVFMSLRLRAI